MDLEDKARHLFESTRNAMGHRTPQWNELHEDTRDMYRNEAVKRSAPPQPGSQK